MSSKLNFEFVSPMASIFSGEVDSVLIPAKEGDAEILPQHAPFTVSYTHLTLPTTPYV